MTARPTAPVLGAAGEVADEAVLDGEVFGAELRPHLVHESVRAEAAARRPGTNTVKTRGQVSGGRSKPWRQKGTGRARAGTTRAPQWTGGAVAFDPRTSFELKVNRKARRSALRGALSQHAARGTLAIVDGAAFAGAPSTKRAAELVGAWAKELPLLAVATEQEEGFVRSLRNLARVAVVAPSELEVSAVVWARSLLVTREALELVQAKAAA